MTHWNCTCEREQEYLSKIKKLEEVERVYKSALDEIIAKKNKTDLRLIANKAIIDATNIKRSKQ